MKYRPLTTAAALSAMSLALAMPAAGQSRSDRAAELAELLATSTANTQDDTYADERTATPAQLMRATLTNVDLDEVSAKMALEMWSIQTEVPLVINWNALEAEGIDIEAPVTINLRRVPAETALRLILRQMNPDPIGDDELLLEVTDWYVQILTKGEALRNSTTKMYFIGDLLMDIPNFEGPEFDLNEALSNTNSGGSNNSGGGGGGGGGLFDDDNNANDEPSVSREERAEMIADIIRDTIEPDIWEANGGEHASVRYFRGMLVVKAPQYVHDQIGVPTTGADQPRSRRASSRNNDARSDRPATRRDNRRRTNGVSGTSSGARTVR